MKKTKLLFILCLLFLGLLFISCDDDKKIDKEAIINKAIELVSIPNELIDNINLPNSIIVDEKEVSISWESLSDKIDNNGIITRTNEDINVTLKAKYVYETKEITHEYNIVIKALEETNEDKIKQNLEIIKKAIEKVSFDSIIDANINLVKEIEIDGKTVNVKWNSSNEALTNEGVINPQKDDTLVLLEAEYTYNEVIEKKIYSITVAKIKIDYESLLNKAIDSIILPNEVEDDIKFVTETEIESNLFEVIYESNNQAITNEGVVTRTDVDVDVKIIVTVKINELSKSKEFTIKVKKSSELEIINEAYNQISLLFTENNNMKIDLPSSLTINNQKVLIEYQFSNELIDNEGNIYPQDEEDGFVDVSLKLNLDNKIYEKEIKDIKIISNENQVLEAINNLNIPEETNNDINLITKFKNVEIEWSSSNEKLLSSQGECKYTSSETEVALSVLFIIYNKDTEYFYDKEYVIKVKPYEPERRIDMAYEKISIPNEVKNSISLISSFSYDVTGEWTSSNENAISPVGLVKQGSEDVLVTLTLKLSCDNISKEYTFTVLVKKIDMDGCDEIFSFHNLIDLASDFDQAKMTNLVLTNGRIQLKDGETKGTYESKVFKTKNFDEVVGSYSCISSKTATGELAISVRVNGVWSKYFSYGTWGLGLNNLYYNDSDSIAQIATDEIKILNSKTADAIKYRFTMKRTSTTEESPKLALVCMALNIPGYVYKVDTSNLPSQSDYEVPRLYQYDVPEIGSSICSATTTTMLLKYKGFDFTGKGYDYEHEYMANLVADRGHNNPTYGNWSYNMITAGAFGVNAYVGRMYSWDEVKEYLANKGPLGASIAGYFGTYSTNGHLIVVRGYREENGNTTVICNDPAKKNTYYEVTLATFMNCWRNVVYIVE